ncbi:MAG: TasA family protein [Tumebacillaceae bacterium]
MAKAFKKVALTMATTALGAALIGGSSFALFTSSTTNNGNTFTAGTVVVKDITGGSISSQEVNFSNLAPGDHKTLNLTVKNDGSLDEWVRINGKASDNSKTGAIFDANSGVTLNYHTDDVVKLAPGDTHVFKIDYNFPKDADNSYQGTTGSFNVVVDAVQARNNTNAGGTGPQSWN